MTEQQAHQHLTVNEAKEAVRTALKALGEGENQRKLRDILDECSKIQDPMLQFQTKFARLLPAVQEVLGAAFKGRDVMSTVMQVQALAAREPELAINVGKVMRALAGDLSGIDQADEEFVEVE